MGAETAGVRFPPPLLFAGAVLLGLGLDRVAPLPIALRIVSGGAFLLLAGLALDVWALATLRRARTTFLPWGRAEALVTTGPYAATRNPIYVGYALEHAGAALLLGSGWALVLLPVAILLTDRLVIAREEAHLEARFGADYEAYRRRVRRWV